MASHPVALAYNLPPQLLIDLLATPDVNDESGERRVVDFAEQPKFPDAIPPEMP